jgi:hypothetical protein
MGAALVSHANFICSRISHVGNIGGTIRLNTTQFEKLNPGRPKSLNYSDTMSVTSGRNHYTFLKACIIVLDRKILGMWGGFAKLFIVSSIENSLQVCHRRQKLMQ